MDDTVRKELKRKIAEVESEIRTQVDIEKELRDSIRKEKEEPERLIKEMEHDANVADEKARTLRRKRDTLVGALRIMEDDVKVPGCEPDYEPSVLADGSLNPDGEYGRMR